ncbi:MAG: protein kinase, partial [Planctomycetaceae bacterium]|nr:protein kinase [Planctomycetaceae bacterium]
MPALHNANQDLLHKLLLGQLPTAEVERLATEYADDGRLAELAESLAGQDDALLDLLHNHETAVVEPEGERLVERLLERLKPALPVKPRDDTAAIRLAGAATEPSSSDWTAKPQPLPERLEYYRPIKVLGQGGMGTVYLAEDTRLGREVAIKTLRRELAANPQAKERFLREARSAAKLEHDHVIPIYSVGEADGIPFLAMPLLKGEPLDALIRRAAGPLPVALAVRMAREMASGLAAAHERGLIHRDIKPANIWLEAPNGRVKILDFGLAKAADAGSEADSETNLTASGAIVGTPAYMAPEQASGHPVDGRADLFSLGCVLYELLSGKRAFSGPTTMSILMSLANHTPAAPDVVSPECPASLSRLVMQLLAKDPANRPASAQAVIQALDELDITGTLARRASEGLEVTTEINPSLARRASTETASSVSATLADDTQIDRLRSSDSFVTLPATEVLPLRRRSIPTQRVALALGGALLMLLAAVVYRIQTDKGTLVVTIHDSAMQAILEPDGLVIHDKNSDRTWTIKAAETTLPSGEFQLKASQQLVVTDDSGVELKTDTFTLKRKDEFRIQVKLEQAASVTGKNSKKSTTSDAKPMVASTNPDRRAAEWVLSIGGTIKITENGMERPAAAIGELPRGAFELTGVGLGQNEKVSDAGLAVFKDCKNLTSLHLYYVNVSPAGLAHFKACRNLTNLSLHSTQTSDAGLAHFQDCKNLMFLDLTYTQASDVGLAYFKDCKNLTSLNLQSTQVSDAG